jgi:hypothetical protein
VDNHWAIVRAVKDEDLSEEERRAASSASI